MFLAPFHQVDPDGIRISGQQASRFAKEIAGDFNPIHDPDAKRFCVPGDLLFALILDRYGLYQRMTFTFTGMVGQGVALSFPEGVDGHITVTDGKGKDYLQATCAGQITRDPGLVEAFTKGYVAFSGRNFPYILLPLMAEQQVMINPDRPLVIYESMSFDLQRLDFTDPRLELADSRLEVKGKRGDARLTFNVFAGDEPVGIGHKKLVLSGLQPYEAARMDALVDALRAAQRSYRAE